MAKMCPYYRGREVQHYEQKNMLDDNGQTVSYKYDMRTDFVPLPCTGENCGAWDKGRCRYAAVSLENN